MSTFDVIGIGFGPANIAVAIAAEELDADLNIHFFEGTASPSWQSGMLFGQSDIQNHPLRDLVTPRNPRSKYTFTNFLFSKDRLFEFLNLGRIFPLRSEYSQYIEWAASHFSHQVDYNSPVVHVNYVSGNSTGTGYYQVMTSGGEMHHARALLLGPGRTPYIPKAFRQQPSPRIIHFTDFVPTIEAMRHISPPPRVAVIGGSQSAVEIILHLSDFFPEAEIVGFSRRFGYRLKDTSPFTGEVYFPEFVDLFLRVDKKNKRQLINDLHFTNYSAADGDVLDALYLKMYQQRIEGHEKIFVRRSSDIYDVEVDHEKVSLRYSQIEKSNPQGESFDLVILATGFCNLGTEENSELFPPLFEPLYPLAESDNKGVIQLNSDYTVRMGPKIAAENPCYLNGLCESTHGMGDAGSFSLLSLRSKVIVESMIGRVLSGCRKGPNARWAIDEAQLVAHPMAAEPATKVACSR